MRNNNHKQDYRFSLTAASLEVDEFLLLAKHLVNSDFDYSSLSYDQLNKERAVTGERKFFELMLRLKQLSKAEIEILIQTSKDNQCLLAFLANVRSYRFLREFIEEVIWHKLVVFDYQLSSQDLNSFMYEKSIAYDEVKKLSTTTQKKVQQVIFKLLEQASLIDSVRSKKIQPKFLDFELQNLLTDLDKRYLLSL